MCGDDKFFQSNVGAAEKQQQKDLIPFRTPTFLTLLLQHEFLICHSIEIRVISEERLFVQTHS